MWFKNLSFFALEGKSSFEATTLGEALAAQPLRQPGPLELECFGFESPYGPDATFVQAVDGGLGLRLGQAARLLPGGVVAEYIQQRMDEIKHKEGRMVGKKERARIKDEVIAELLPRAFIVNSFVDAYVDTKAGWVLVDSASRKRAETLCSEVRKATGSLPLAKPAEALSLQTLLSGFIDQPDSLPDGFTLGDEIELKHPEDGAVARCRKMSLDGEEIQKHRESGKLVTQLALDFDERLSFVVTDTGCLKKLKFFDVVREQLDSSSDQSRAAQQDAEFALLQVELRNMLPRLLKACPLVQGES
jgi:recombination associated protein RdgC